MQLSAFFPRFIHRWVAAGGAYPDRWRWALVAVLAVIVLVMSLKYAAKIHKPGDSGQQTRSAFLRWRAMINGLFAGENIYVGVNEYPNPPIMAFVLKPFTALPPVVGAMSWFYAKVLMAVLAAVWVFRWVEFPLRPACRPQPPPVALASGEHRKGLANPNDVPTGNGSPALSIGESHAGLANSSPVACESGGLIATTPTHRAEAVTALTRRDQARVAAILLCLPPLLGDLSHNNVNMFILFLVVGCLEAFRRHWDTLAGLVLALAIACKVTPLLFLAYFGWKRCWRVVGATLVGLVLWLAVVPGVTFGWERNRELLRGWYALMIERPLLKGEITSEHANQALVGFVYRLFTHSPSYLIYPNNIPTPAEYHNLIDIGHRNAWIVVKLLTATFALAVMWLCRWPIHRPTDIRAGWPFAAECGLICLGMLLFSERTWKHHAVVLLIPLAVLTFAIAQVELPRLGRRVLMGAVAVGFLLMTVPGLLGGRRADLALVYGTHTFAFLLFTAGIGGLLAYRLRRVQGIGSTQGAVNSGLTGANDSGV